MASEIKTQIELKKLKPEEIVNLARPGEIGAILELILTDKDGKITDSRVMKSKSFLRQFLDFLWIQFMWPANKAAMTIKDYSGGFASVFGQHENMQAGAGAGATYWGIVVGTGTNLPAVDDYTLQAQIGHGVGAGQLQYSAVTFGAPASDTTSSQFTVTRNFANASGGSITVNEIGLVLRSWLSSQCQMYHLVLRDVIAGGLAVPNGQTLTVNYRIIVVA